MWAFAQFRLPLRKEAGRCLVQPGDDLELSLLGLGQEPRFRSREESESSVVRPVEKPEPSRLRPLSESEISLGRLRGEYELPRFRPVEVSEQSLVQNDVVSVPSLVPPGEGSEIPVLGGF